jgi:prolipoprotein diacylglyceryltransferase
MDAVFTKDDLMPAWLLSLIILTSQAMQYAAVRSVVSFVRSPMFGFYLGFLLFLFGVMFSSIPFILVGFGVMAWCYRRNNLDDVPPVSPA